LSSIYIHFPYCLYKCHYCDFNSYATEAGEIPFIAYQNALLKELSLRKQVFEKSGTGFLKPGTTIKTIFFGGGTPSLMPADLVAGLLESLADYYTLAGDCEITLEANPGTLNQNSIQEFNQAGINRISIGVQSLNEKYLSAFGRIHSASQATQVLNWLGQSSLKSWNADLIFGFPGESLEEWQLTLESLLAYQPPHVSCYSFMVEADAPYGRWVKEGRAQAPDDEVQGEMFVYTRNKLISQGYGDYEISNYARAGHECRHNLTYWHYHEYLGLGAGAVSLLAPQKEDTDFVIRTNNVKNPSRYIQAVKEGDSFFESESISKDVAQKEWFLMNLRLLHGCTEADYQKIFKEPFSAHQKNIILTLRNRGLIATDKLALTESGVLLANEVMRAFI